MKKFVLDLNKVNDIKQILNNRTCYLTCSGRLDGIGAQTWAMISTMMTAKFLGFTYIHTPFQNVDHNDLNVPSKRWNQTWDNTFKMDKCYTSMNDWNHLSQKGNKVLLDWKQLFGKNVENINKFLKNGNCYIVKESHDFVNMFHGEMQSIIQEVISSLQKAFHDKSITTQIPKYMMVSKPVINIKFKHKNQHISTPSSKGRPPTVVNKTIIKPPSINIQPHKGLKNINNQTIPMCNLKFQQKPKTQFTKQSALVPQQIKQIQEIQSESNIEDKILVSLANTRNAQDSINNVLVKANTNETSDIIAITNTNETNDTLSDIPNTNENTVQNTNFISPHIDNLSQDLSKNDNLLNDHFCTLQTSEDKILNTKKENNKTSCSLYRKDKIDIAVHVRKGDVIEWNITTRITPNEYFINIIKQLHTMFGDKARIHIFSEGTIHSDFPELEKIQNSNVNIDYFTQVGENNEKITNNNFNLVTLKDKDESTKDLIINMHLNGDARHAFSHLVNADILVTCKSCFSYVAAILNENGTILFSEFWFPSLSKDWITLDKNGFIPT